MKETTVIKNCTFVKSGKQQYREERDTIRCVSQTPQKSGFRGPALKAPEEAKVNSAVKGTVLSQRLTEGRSHYVMAHNYL